MNTDEYRQAVDDNVAASAKRQGLLNKGLLDPAAVSREAEEADVSGERASRREMQEHREALKQGEKPVTNGEFDAFVADMQGRFNGLLDIVDSHLKRIEKLERTSFKVATFEQHLKPIVEDAEPARVKRHVRNKKA
ncbi:MAG: hypothetical protein WCD38_11615 [Candidatus Tumulicola sp.]